MNYNRVHLKLTREREYHEMGLSPLIIVDAFRRDSGRGCSNNKNGALWDDVPSKSFRIQADRHLRLTDKSYNLKQAQKRYRLFEFQSQPSLGSSNWSQWCKASGHGGSLSATKAIYPPMCSSSLCCISIYNSCCNQSTNPKRQSHQCYKQHIFHFPWSIDRQRLHSTLVQGGSFYLWRHPNEVVP